ncbi:3-coathanger stack domain-containing protein [uncultured Arcticibacterium sp.]|uniref:3-coathanger stack domain-containing protein n=1 Tax=uncultured Arcticibacterium sp. TaxID=2173042 RepID=UPI0030F60C9F
MLTKTIIKVWYVKKTLLTLAMVWVSLVQVCATDFIARPPLFPGTDGVPVMIGEFEWSNPLCWLPYTPGNTIEEGDRVLLNETGFKITNSVLIKGRLVIQSPTIVEGVTINSPLLIVEEYGSLNIGATGVLNNQSRLILRGLMTNYGDVFNAKTFTIADTGLFDNYKNLYNDVNEFSVAGTLNNNEGGLIQNQYSGNIQGTGTVTLRATSNFNYFSNQSQIPANTFNWLGGTISVYEGRTLALGREFSVPAGGLLNLDGGTLNINSGGKLTVENTALIVTEGFSATHGKVNINAYGNLIFKGAFLYDPTDYNWESDAIITIASVVKVPGINVPLGAILEIAPTGVLNITAGRKLILNYANGLDNKGRINLSSTGSLTFNGPAHSLPNGIFDWSSEGIVIVSPGAALYLGANDTIPANASMTNYGKIELGTTDFVVKGKLLNFELSSPSVSTGGIYNTSIRVADGGNAEFNSYTTPGVVPFIQNLKIESGGTVETEVRSNYVLQSKLEIPDGASFINNGILTIPVTDTLSIAVGGAFENTGTTNNDGLVENAGDLSNRLAFWNNNIFNNTGILYDFSAFTNVGTLNNLGRIGMFGTFEDRGIFNNTNEINLYDTFLLGSSDVFENGTVLYAPGSKLWVMKPFALHKSLDVPVSAELRIISKLSIADGVVVSNYGDLNFGTSGNGICEIKSGGSLIAFSSTTAMPDSAYLEPGSYIAINEPAFVSKTPWLIPEGVTLTINGYLNSSNLTNHGIINVVGKLSSSLLTNEVDGLLTLYGESELTSAQKIINRGTLDVYGTLSSNTLDNYGTLRGSGNLSGAFSNFENSEIAPGPSLGSRLNFTTKKYRSGNDYPFEMGLATYNCGIGAFADQIVTTGNAKIENAKLNLSFPEIPAAGQYLIMGYNGHTGEFANVTIPYSFCVDVVLQYEDNALYALVTTKKDTAYVNKSATPGTASGRDWENAFLDLQPALEIGCPVNVWVAEGTYTPSKSPYGEENPTDPRDKTFYLHDGLKIFGGFTGNETDIFSRNWNLHPTILSGDFNNDDNVTGELYNLRMNNNEENAYHVVLSVNDDFFTTLDGVKVKGGNANGSGRIIVEGQDIHQSNGGGLISASSSVVSRNMTYENNSASNSGGGVYLHAGVPTLDGVNMVKNYSGVQGGGLTIEVSYATVYNCVFYGNRSLTYGGGIYTNFTPTTLYNTLFIENASTKGGAIYNYQGDPNYVNSTITKNYAAINGAIIHSNGGQFSNSICYDNQGFGIYQMLGSMEVDYSNIQGGRTGIANVDVAPSFVSTDYDGPDNIFGTADDGLQLKYCSALIDKGTNEFTTSLDLSNQERVVADKSDIGAYENQDKKTLIVEDLVPASTTKLARYIEGESFINAPSKVEYKAVHSVLLTPGFETQNDVVFQANIGSECEN